jgi:hypothetical protein
MKFTRPGTPDDAIQIRKNYIGVLFYYSFFKWLISKRTNWYIEYDDEMKENINKLPTIARLIIDEDNFKIASPFYELRSLLTQLFNQKEKQKMSFYRLSPCSDYTDTYNYKLWIFGSFEYDGRTNRFHFRTIDNLTSGNMGKWNSETEESLTIDYTLIPRYLESNFNIDKEFYWDEKIFENIYNLMNKCFINIFREKILYTFFSGIY